MVQDLHWGTDASSVNSLTIWKTKVHYLHHKTHPGPVTCSLCLHILLLLYPFQNYPPSLTHAPPPRVFHPTRISHKILLQRLGTKASVQIIEGSKSEQCFPSPTVIIKITTKAPPPKCIIWQGLHLHVSKHFRLKKLGTEHQRKNRGK